MGEKTTTTRKKRMVREIEERTKDYQQGYKDAIKHAEWIITADGIRCSRCDVLMTVYNIRKNYYDEDTKRQDLRCERETINSLYSFCPSCGAKMDAGVMRDIELYRIQGKKYFEEST